MNYYKVSEKMDQKRTANGTIFVKNELLTKKQLEKMGGKPEQFEKLEISQRKTYWFFGARFVMND